MCLSHIQDLELKSTYESTRSPEFKGPFLNRYFHHHAVSHSVFFFEAEKKRSKLADDGDLSELFDALELEDDGKALGFPSWGEDTFVFLSWDWKMNFPKKQVGCRFLGW